MKKPTTQEQIAALQKRVEELEKRPATEKVVEHHYYWPQWTQQPTWYYQPIYQQPSFTCGSLTQTGTTSAS